MVPGDEDPGAHDHDELISQRVTVLGNAFGPDDRRHRRVISNGKGGWRVVVPLVGLGRIF